MTREEKKHIAWVNRAITGTGVFHIIKDGKFYIHEKIGDYSYLLFVPEVFILKWELERNDELPTDTSNYG